MTDSRGRDKSATEYLFYYFAVSERTAVIRDHTETVMAVLVGGEVDSVETVMWAGMECRMEYITG